MKRIGILTSGGDTPGMNAAIRATFKACDAMGMETFGIYHGYVGLIAGRIEKLNHAQVENIMHKGGTILRTSRSEEFKTEDGRKKAYRMLCAYDIEGVVVIGGDGSFKGAELLNDMGVAIIGIPGTIDNDMGYTDFTIGFDTAVNTITNEIYNIRDTMRAHDRVGVVEVMGRNCGDIALWAGIAGAADLILTSECCMEWDEAAAKLMDFKLRGKLTSIVVIAEGAGRAADFAEFVHNKTGIDIKAIVPGYVQRGGNPTASDRVLASRFGMRAAELLKNDIGGRAVGIKDNKIIDVSFAEAIATLDCFDKKLYDFSNDVLARF
ncbi:MAG: 6-phosphofructokinase [Clostridia bacterium]|nr:6-phosphofructokinase [Clostridia bacterium]